MKYLLLISSIIWGCNLAGTEFTNVNYKCQNYHIDSMPVSGFIDIRDFGAIPDDTINDHASIQAALMFAAIQGLGCDISGGTYLIDQRLFLSGFNRMHIKGTGTIKYMDNIERGDGNEAKSIFHFDDVDNLTIEGLNLDANWFNRPTDGTDKPAHNIRLRGCDHVIIKEINNLSSVSDCITMQKYAEDIPEDVSIQNVRCSYFFRSGISIINGRDITIDGCDFSNPQMGSLGGGINVEPNTGEIGTAQDIRIYNCDFTSNLNYGIQIAEKKPRDTNGVEITRCRFKNIVTGLKCGGSYTVRESTFENLSGNAIDARGAPGVATPYIEIKDCTFRNNGSRVVYANGETYSVAFEDCKVTNCGRTDNVPALNLFADTVSITGNEFRDNYWAVSMQTTRRSTIKGNVFDHHDKYSIYSNAVANLMLSDNDIIKSSRVSFSTKGYLLLTSLLNTYTVVTGNNFIGDFANTAIEIDDNNGRQIISGNLFEFFTNVVRYDAGPNVDSYVPLNTVDGYPWTLQEPHDSNNTLKQNQIYSTYDGKLRRKL